MPVNSRYCGWEGLVAASGSAAEAPARAPLDAPFWRDLTLSMLKSPTTYEHWDPQIFLSAPVFFLSPELLITQPQALSRDL